MHVPLLDLRPAVEEVRPALDEAYRRVMDSGRFIHGEELEAFELEFARAVGTAHCVGVANGLEALQLVLMALELAPDDEVIVPAHGYIATWLAATHAGVRLVPCECDERTYNLDPAAVAARLTPRTRAILPIHLYGQTADMEALSAIAARHGIFLLEDAAQAHGARCRGRASGSLGHAAGISFYPSKNLGACADAGAVTTSDAVLADRLRHLRNYGARIRYQNEYAGLNSRLGELQAAFLRAKLPLLSAWNERRRRIADAYLRDLAGVGDLVLPFVPAWAEPAWHLFVIRTGRRAALQEHLRGAGVETQIHYPTPPHLSGAYRKAGWKRGDFPVAERLAGEVLSLPLGPHLDSAQAGHVCASIRNFFKCA